MTTATPHGYLVSDDCDDTEAAANPGATEVCGDGLDNDCDGALLADCALTGSVSPTDADASIIGASESDVLGISLSSVTVAAEIVVVVGAYGRSSGSGSVFLYAAEDLAGGTLAATDANAELTGEDAGDHAGYAVAGVGDHDGDGVEDVLVGAYLEDAGGSSSGAAYLVPGDTTGTVPLASASAKLIGEEAGDYAGAAVAGAGDVDGDGYDDLLVGAIYDDEGGRQAGAAYLVFGPTAGTLDLASAGAKLGGEDADDNAGISLAAGDVDGDGTPDLVIPADDADGTEVGAGKVYVWTSAPSGTVDLGGADIVVTGAYASQGIGYSLAVGDFDGDGYGDLVTGAPNGQSDGHGAVYLFAGPLAAALTEDDAAWVMQGEETNEAVGNSLADAGDVDADGVNDLVVGAPHGTASHDGQAALFYAPLAGSAVWSDAAFVVTARADWHELGGSVAGLGDLDGDG